MVREDFKGLYNIGIWEIQRGQMDIRAVWAKEVMGLCLGSCPELTIITLTADILTMTLCQALG